MKRLKENLNKLNVHYIEASQDVVYIDYKNSIFRVDKYMDRIVVVTPFPYNHEYEYDVMVWDVMLFINSVIDPVFELFSEELCVDFKSNCKKLRTFVVGRKEYTIENLQSNINTLKIKINE